MATAAAKLPRSLSAIVLDLITTRQRLASLYVHDELTDEEDRRCSMLGDRQSALEAEFASTFEATTGVAWDVAQKAMS
jgi:hypothetical protein